MISLLCCLALIVPGPQPDGSTLLHNQWPIRPVGRQVELGNYPIALAIDPSGRYAAVLHAGREKHEIRLVDLVRGAAVQSVPLHLGYGNLEFSSDGARLVASGGPDNTLLVLNFHDGRLDPPVARKLPSQEDYVVTSGVALRRGGRTAYFSQLFASRVGSVDLDTGAIGWTTSLDAPGTFPERGPVDGTIPGPGGLQDLRPLVGGSDPFALVWDRRRDRIYASLWGESGVAVLDATSGRQLGRWTTGLHPNQLVLSPNGRRLFVSNGGVNSVTVLDTRSGAVLETLSSSFEPGDPPGATPDSLALSPDGHRLFVANATFNTVAVFDVSKSGHGRALGFIPTGWLPSAVRVTPDGRHLLVVSARGLTPKPNNLGETTGFAFIANIYQGSLGIVDLPAGDDFDRALAGWTAAAELCRPRPAPAPAVPGDPIPEKKGDATPIRYVIYVIKENRTYDQVFGDMPEGNGDPKLCLFPEQVTPNLHKIARQFVLLDNFYANAEVSASGHEWSMAGYSTEFVEKNWPVAYIHEAKKMPYPAEGRFAAALPALGYIWDRARAAGISYRDYGEFIVGDSSPKSPATSDEPALVGHVDPLYRGWDLTYPDTVRIGRFLSDLREFEQAGDMPRLQIVRLPNDHTSGGLAGAFRPRAMVADNDLAVGQIVEAVSHSRFWPQTAIFIVEDDAQNGPDHVDAHRTEALVVSPYVRRHAVDSSPYTTCSMLATIERILGLQPMSAFDAWASPMRASFQATADLSPYSAVAERIDTRERNPQGTKAAALSRRMDWSREDANDDLELTRAVWLAERGDAAVVPAPVHAAFLHPLPSGDGDDDDD